LKVTFTWPSNDFPRSNQWHHLMAPFKPYNLCLKHFFLKCMVYEIFDRFQTFGTPCIYSRRLRGNFRSSKGRRAFISDAQTQVTPLRLVPSFHLQLPSSFRRQPACNVILTIEVSSVGATFTPRYESRMKHTREFHVTLFQNLKYVDCITCCGAGIMYPVVALGKERNYDWWWSRRTNRLLKLILLARYFEE